MLGLAPIAVGLLATAGGVLASVTDSATAGIAELESMVVNSIPSGTIGDRVYEDSDDDGRRDPGEAGVGGVTVHLLDQDGQPAQAESGALIPPEVTDASGHYEFTGLARDVYRVGFADLPEGARFTATSAESDVDDDSDADPATGVTPPIELSDGERDLTIDAGVFIPAPDIEVQTRVQGVDTGAGPGPIIPIGAAVGIDYLITNTGNERLVRLAVTDDHGLPVTCPRRTIAVGQTVFCSATTPAVGGQQRHLGVAVAHGADSATEVADDDPAHYVGGAQGLEVEKRVEGSDADVATVAPEVVVGTSVTYTFSVTNAGPAPVLDISLLDMPLGEIACPALELAPGATMDCEPRTVVVQPGLNTNVAVADGWTDDAAQKVRLVATDAATVFGEDPRLVLLKESFDPARRLYLDADGDQGSPGSNDPTAAFLERGATARYRMQITNTGNVDLPDVAVVDPGCDSSPQLVLGGFGDPATLEVGETWTLRCLRDGVSEAFTNVAEASANGVAASERARVEISDGRGGVEIEKLVRGPDSTDFGPTAVLEAGQAATFRISVTNVGTRPLVDVVVRDPQVSECDHVIPGPLEPGQTTTAVLCTTEPLSVRFTNAATVSARPLGSVENVTAVGRADVTISAPKQPDLAVSKALLSRLGNAVDWVVTVQNLGPGRAEGPIGVIDDLPAGLAFVSSTSAGWNCTATDQIVRCDGPGLAEGESSSVVLATRLLPGASPELVNTARLASPDGLGGNDTGQAALSGAATTPTTLVLTTAPCPTTPVPSAPRSPTEVESSTAERPTTPSASGDAGDPDSTSGGPKVAGAQLARTGVNTGGLWITGLSLVALGLLLLWSGRRRRRLATEEIVMSDLPTQRWP